MSYEKIEVVKPIYSEIFKTKPNDKGESFFVSKISIDLVNREWEIESKKEWEENKKYKKTSIRIQRSKLTPREWVVELKPKISKAWKPYNKPSTSELMLSVDEFDWIINSLQKK